MRAAARELIAAGRSFLDAAEAMIDDPNATERVRVVVAFVIEQAQRMIADATDGVAPRTEGVDERP